MTQVVCVIRQTDLTVPDPPDDDLCSTRRVLTSKKYIFSRLYGTWHTVYDRHHFKRAYLSPSLFAQEIHADPFILPDCYSRLN